MIMHTVMHANTRLSLCQHKMGRDDTRLQLRKQTAYSPLEYSNAPTRA